MSYRTYEQDSYRFSTPRITWAVQRLIFLCTGIFALQLLLAPLELLLFGRTWAVEWLAFHPFRLLEGHVWRPFTYIFLHAGLLHLFLNMLWLFIFGPEVERVLGTRGFFRFFIICGVVSVMATYVPTGLSYFFPQSFAPTGYVVGASGAVMAVLIAFAYIDPDRQFYLIPLPFPITARALVIIVVTLNLLSVFRNTGVSVSTHFGGLLVGYLYMKFLPRFNAWARERRRAAPRRKKSSTPLDKVGEEVDNIFKFQDRDRR